jgi:hypothetical protein
MGYQCYQVIANIELDIEEIIYQIIEDYGYESVNDVQMDDIFEYIKDHITYLDNQWGGRGIKIVEDGPSINGIEAYDYDRIEQILESMQTWD